MTRYKGFLNDKNMPRSDYDKVMAHARPTDEGHLLWEGRMEPRGYPVFALAHNGQKRTITVRRWLWCRANPGITNPWLTNVCGEARCVEPKHQKNVARVSRKNVKPRRVREVRASRAALIRSLGGVGHTPENISAGLGVNLATVQRLLHTSTVT